ncbi:Shedu immune nuclease family protein [Arthrobacter sp. ok362]|uniref:Shedu immune nuclease family protein n=1 Tax=Arthrobacter sp. ok362 TaxID=1761745 RepID=UPI000B808E00|nr:Shedu immune nuclease family protein [Arthrobacter sp. ok362]
MTRAITDDAPLDASERSALVVRMQAEPNEIATQQPQAFGKVREDLKLVTLDVLIENFSKSLTGNGAKNEDAWQQFFKANTFALKQIFAAPVAFYGEQVHVRSPDMKGAGGQIADFVLFNTLTRSMVLVEIKTPSAALVAKNKYRGASSAEVYPPDKELSGAIAQLQAQMESARTDFDQIVRRTPGAGPLDTKVVTGAVIAGTLGSMDQLRKDSFVRYRNGLHGIEVITFDEVLDRLLALQTMLKESGYSWFVGSVNPG